MKEWVMEHYDEDDYPVMVEYKDCWIMWIEENEGATEKWGKDLDPVISKSLGSDLNISSELSEEIEEESKSKAPSKPLKRIGPQKAPAKAAVIETVDRTHKPRCHRSAGGDTSRHYGQLQR